MWRIFVIFMSKYRNAQISKHALWHTNRRESAQQVRNTATSDDWHFRTASTLLSTYRRIFADQSPNTFRNLQRKYELLSNTSPQPPSDITDGGTSSWVKSRVLKTNCNYLENCQFTPKTGNQNIQPVRFCTKMQIYPLPYYRVGLFNFNQSRAARGTFARGWGRRGGGGRGGGGGEGGPKGGGGEWAPGIPGHDHALVRSRWCHTVRTQTRLKISHKPFRQVIPQGAQALFWSMMWVAKRFTSPWFLCTTDRTPSGSQPLSTTAFTASIKLKFPYLVSVCVFTCRCSKLRIIRALPFHSPASYRSGGFLRTFWEVTIFAGASKTMGYGPGILAKSVDFCSFVTWPIKIENVFVSIGRFHSNSFVPQS